MNRSTIFLAAILSALIGAGLLFFTMEKKEAPPTCQAPLVISSRPKETEIPAPPQYTAETFDLVGRLKGLTAKQINEHEQLYRGYVKKRNEIAQKLRTVDRSSATSTTYSPYRALKISQTYAMNGDILHRLYFGNMSNGHHHVGAKMKKLIEESFGSLHSFKEDLFAAARSSRGWVITAFTLDDGRIENYVLDAHNLTVPVMVMPLLVLDVYEHAYMIDYGINRPKYLDAFWNNIDWDVIEERIEKWVTPFIQE